ncbi:hypothetical protein [Halalkalicoccus sp. NIPERK01]|uniref:hypothetical protein n=1 Tax=Halalkalicoccus sp. NIPERK01 TaxID=3053469 RepID=UPI00256EFD58|nr:hypothetical protein [Halalkalicoccus sp. NIPERK01]MDL5363735.1 hypothetical protein [Halalkalicoccus sp. NIPERK01]
MSTGELEPFHGIQVPGVCFESGHCVWLLRFTETPTDLPSYTEVWLITPDGGTTLFVDPEEAAATVEEYHAFDEVRGAEIDVALPDQETIRVTVAGDTDLEFDLTHELTPRARALSAMLNATPERVARSRIGAAVGTATLNTLLPANGLRVAGTTDTGRRYRNEPVRVTLGTDASATLDGEDLGGLAPPTRPIAFGDLHVPDRPVVTFGDLFLEYPVK